MYDILSNDSNIESEFIEKMKYFFYHMTVKNLFIFLAAFTSFIIIESVCAAEPNLYIPPINIQKGQTVKIPIKIDHVEKLAGIKLVVEYDIKHLMYEKVDKLDITSSLMHVVNDKNPGKLIIVMAGAKGVSGNDFEIITIQFKAIPGLKETAPGSVKITEAEFVSEDLKTIPCRIVENAFVILPEK